MKLVNILDVVKIANGSVDKFSGIKRYIATGDLSENIISSYNEVTYDNRPSRANIQVKVGQVIFARMKDTKKVLLIDDDNVDFIYSTGFCVFEPSKSILSDYLRVILNSDLFQNQKDKYSKGATQKAINNEGLKKIQIPLPPLEIQKKIIEVLDKAQGLIDARKEQIRLMDELIQSVFYEMFGDPVTNPKGWEKYRLEKFISFLTSGSRGWSQYFRNKGEMFLTIKNVKNNEITLDNIQYVSAPNTKEAERTKVQEGDLLISITADLGRTGVVNSEIAQYGAYINQHLSLVRLNDEYVRSMYVSYFLESKGGKIQFDAKNQNGVKAGLNFNAIRSLELLVPPIHLQDEFVENVSAINQSKSDMQKNLDEIYNNYNALMQKAFKGDLFGGE